MCYTFLFITIFIGIEISNQMMTPSSSSMSKHDMKNNGRTENVDFSKIALHLFKNDEEVNDLEKCRKVGFGISWSILWELELLKMENASADILGEENKSIGEPKNHKQFEENIKEIYFELQKAKYFEMCQIKLNEIWEILKNNDFGQSSNSIHHIIESAGKLDTNPKPSKMDKFIGEFMAKNNFELELVKKFADFEFNKKTDLANHGEEYNIQLMASKELAIAISDVQKLILKLKGQNDIKKIGEIANELTKNVKILKGKLDEWAKLEVPENLEWSNWKKKLERILNTNKLFGSLVKELDKLLEKTKEWEKEEAESDKEFSTGIINGNVLELTNQINLIRWDTQRIMPEEEVEVIKHKEAQQFILKLALLRRFLLSDEISQRNEPKRRRFLLFDKQMQMDDEKQQKILQHKLEQKFKWILRRRQRIEDQIQEKQQKEHFRIKFKRVLAKIGQELEKSPTAKVNHSFFEVLLERPLRQYYYGNEEGNTLKIRPRAWGGHYMVTLGNAYEYDYLNKENPSRRRIFKKWLDAEIGENDKGKAQPIKGLPEFSVAQADAIFFEMPSKGWIGRNYSEKDMQRCVTYVYEFVFHLNGQKFPQYKQWPEFFREIGDELSIFSEEYSKVKRKRFNPEEKNTQNDGLLEQCTIKELEIQIKMFKGKEWNKEKSYYGLRNIFSNYKYQAAESSKVIGKKLPAIIVYDTGRFEQITQSEKSRNCPFKFEQPLNIQEHLVKVAETPEAILYSALLKVNVCKVDGMPRAFLNNVHLWDNEMKSMVYAFGGVNLYEENGGGHHLLTLKFGELRDDDDYYYRYQCKYKY